jgi:hypothetical protein
MQSTEQMIGAGGKCASGLGAYKLPKTNLRIKVSQAISETPPVYVLETLEPVRRADERYTFCLDYLASPLANDDVQVNRSRKSTPDDPVTGKPVVVPISTASPFLQLVTSHAVDATAIIIRKLVRTIFIGLSQNANFTPARTLPGKAPKMMIAADLEFDPFDPQETSEINQRLRQLGFCVVLEDFTFDRRNARPGAYCDNPRSVAQHHPSIAAKFAAETQPLKANVAGIHYRPRASYSLSLYANDDPEGGGSWRLAKLQTVGLENISPILALGVDRALFAARRTALVFDDGVLVQLCIAKGSEIEGAIQIPLDVVYGLVALPSQIMQVQIETANLNTKVIEAENAVIQAQKDLINYKTAGAGLPRPAYKQLAPDRPDLIPGEPGDTSIAGSFDKQLPTVRAITADSNALKDICKGVEGQGDLTTSGQGNVPLGGAI